MATWADICAAALQDLGVLQAGETPSAEDQAYCTQRLNRLLDAWKAQRLQIPSLTRTTWTIVSGTATYTVGSGGTVDIARPVKVEHVNVIETANSQNIEIPLMPMTDDAYAAIAIKALTSPYPTSFWYNPTFPLANLFLWPVPSSTTLQGALYWLTALATVSAATDSYSVQPGYRRMIETALALEIAPGFGKEPSPSLQRQAQASMAVVKNSNFRMTDLAVDPGALGHTLTRADRWSIYTGP